MTVQRSTGVAIARMSVSAKTELASASFAERIVTASIVQKSAVEVQSIASGRLQGLESQGDRSRLLDSICVSCVGILSYMNHVEFV